MPAKRRPARAAPKREPSAMQMKLTVAGDRRLAENVVLEVRALARRFGLEIKDVEMQSGARPRLARPRGRAATRPRQ